MLINAVFEQGQIRLPAHFQFIHDFFQVKVDVPDVEIVDKFNVMSDQTHVILGGTGNAVCCKSSDSLGRLNESNAEYAVFKQLQDKLFGSDYKYESEKSDDEIIHEHWLEKYA